jgi:hypothetical protein
MKPRALDPHQARESLAHRLAPRVDRLRQRVVRAGLRPYRVALVWTRWAGQERGEGQERPLGRIEILPSPKVTSLDNVAYRLFSGGTLPVGSVRITEISALYTSDQLRGLAVPTPEFIARNDPPRPESAACLPPRLDDRGLPDPLDFYWEVWEDGRGDDPAERMKFRLMAVPMRMAGGVQWAALLERVSVDALRDGTSVSGYDP